MHFNSTHPWRWKSFLLSHLLIALLLLSFFIPLSASWWAKIDLSCFQFLNTPLKHNETLRVIWALANHRLADWLEDLCILTFYIVAIYKTAKHSRLKKGLQFFFCLLLTALTILLINRLFCRDFLRLRRASPTLVIDSATYLSDFISWIPVKVHSGKSFPGDHATVALLFACTYAYLVRGKLAIFALLYAMLLCIPRLAVGAHWLSDIVVGSGSIVLFSISWAFFTPFADWVVEKGEKALRKIFQKPIVG